MTIVVDANVPEPGDLLLHVVLVTATLSLLLVPIVPIVPYVNPQPIPALISHTMGLFDRGGTDKFPT